MLMFKTAGTFKMIFQMINLEIRVKMTVDIILCQDTFNDYITFLRQKTLSRIKMKTLYKVMQYKFWFLRYIKNMNKGLQLFNGIKL